MPVSTRSLEIGDWYQGRSRLKTITAQPITAIRSLPPSPRRSRTSFRGTDLQPLLERLAATVASLELVPVADLVLAELPAQVDLSFIQQSGEVDQAAVDVPEDEARLLDRLEQAPDLEEGDPDLLALLAAAVPRRRLGEGLVGLGVGQVVLGVAQLIEHRRQLREQCIRLLAREVTLVNEAGALFAHAPVATLEDRHSRRRPASASPIVRSCPWKARCQWSSGHLRTCSSSVTSSSAGTKSSSGRIRTGSASTRQG